MLDIGVVVFENALSNNPLLYSTVRVRVLYCNPRCTVIPVIQYCRGSISPPISGDHA